MTEWADFKPLLHQALEGQGFRQVPLDELVAAPFHLPGASTEVDAALQGVTNDPNWVEITRQLAQLSTPNDAFAGLHMRRDTYDLELVPIYAWTGAVTRDLVVGCMEWVYSCVYRISKVLGDFELPEAAAAVLDQATANLAPPAKPLLDFVVDLNRARMPNTTLLAVDADGFDATLAEEFDRRGLSKSSPNPFSLLNRPVVFVALVDGATGNVHGHNELASLDLPVLKSNLGFLAGT